MQKRIYPAASRPLSSALSRRAEPAPPEMNYRSAPFAARTDGPATLDEKSRSVEVVLSTENPATVYDWDRGRISEVLLMEGAELPESRQLVLLDAHSRYETQDVIGSVREIRIEGDRMVGRAFFSTAPEAESAWTKTREGHLTDYSVGYRVDESVWIPAGQTATVSGRPFAGPVQIATKWTPRELSAVPIGADAAAKARAGNPPTETRERTSPPSPSHPKEEKNMDPKLRNFLERSGLPKAATEAEAWLFLETLGRREEAGAAAPPAPDAAAPAAAPDLDRIRAEAKGDERTRIREIDALLTKYDCQELARELIVGVSGQDLPTLADAQRRVMDRIHERAQNPGFSGVRLGADEKDKFRAAANDALLLRAGMAVSAPVPGAQELRGYTLVEMARECLRMAGINHHGATKEMVGRAMTSSDFPNLLANLATKSMQQAWETVAETWQSFCGVGSVSDFKTYYDNALSEHDDLEEVPDSGEIKYGAFSEKLPETYRAASYAKKFRITRVMIINDDLGALTAMPARRAEAAARKIGDIAYAVLTANGNMGDSVPIFDAAAHGNDAVSGATGAPGIATIAEGIRAMGVQTDIGGKRRLNIRPVFFIAPKALEGVSEIFFRSEKFSDPNTIATDSSLASTRANPYAGAYFTRVYDARLDADDTAQWYLAAAKGRTVKVVFLNGVQAPLMEMRQPGFTIEGFEYLVSIDAGAYATDYRGLYRNAGD